MEAPSAPRELSPPPTVLVTAPPTLSNRKRKHAAIANVAAGSPAPSDPGATPSTAAAENLVLPARPLDLSTRPRLTISRHPVFVPISPGSHFCHTEPLCNNRLNFRYTPAGLAAEGAVHPFRTIESAPTSFRVSWEDRSPFVKVTQDGLALQGEKGFRSARCNAPVREGKWYMEVKLELGGGEKPSEGKWREGAHVRLGWARREAPLNGPAGLDGYSYALRDKNGDKVHLSRPRPYGQQFGSGDVVGMYISLPSPRRKPAKKDLHDPAHIKRERIAIEFKGQEYFESLEYPQSKEMLALLDAQTRPTTRTSASVPPSATKKSATVKNLPSSGRGAKTAIPDPAPLRPLPTLGPDARIAFFVNGKSQGIAFQDLLDYLPLKASPNKTQEKKKANKEGLREHKENPFDDGSLGYYPFISLFNEARVRINPGPDFDFPPPPDIDALLDTADSFLNEDVKPVLTDKPRTWRPMCERYPEYIAEQNALDDQEEAEARAALGGTNVQDKADLDKAEAHRAKRRAQAAARRQKKMAAKAQEDAEALDQQSKRKKMEESVPADAMMPGQEIAPIRNSTDVDDNQVRLLAIDTSAPSTPYLGVEFASSPAPTVASSVDIHMHGYGPLHDTHDNSEYNTEYEEADGDADVAESGRDIDGGSQRHYYYREPQSNFATDHWTSEHLS